MVTKVEVVTVEKELSEAMHGFQFPCVPSNVRVSSTDFIQRSSKYNIKNNENSVTAAVGSSEQAPTFRLLSRSRNIPCATRYCEPATAGQFRESEHTLCNAVLRARNSWASRLQGEVRKSAQKATNVYYALSRCLFGKEEVDKNTKTRVYQAVLESILLQVNYCNWFVQSVHNGDVEPLLTFFTDEAWFHLYGHISTQNNRYWATKNPHIIHEVPHHAAKVRVWCAEPGGSLPPSHKPAIGPYPEQD
ncbi:hypothetical protein ANN_06403 [Periplaneta americana]|uniref:Uncharacterized protein n=1 Tax=Periplaneta americana TaxID=6978 RepID=A0ABQ8TF95_PERAM|nr:hypothetical protein ANN_06403 [Periplaneta americana]